MKAKTRLTLLDGKFICEVAFPREFDYLCDPANQACVNAWLNEIDMRLARVGAEGAFFMAPSQISASDANKIRDEFARYRDVYGVSLRMLQLIRSGKDEFTLAAGQFVTLTELSLAVNESATLESQLRSLQTVIREGSARFKNRELLKKLLTHLETDGYLVEVNANTETYQTTGKVEQLQSVLAFVAEHTDIIGQDAGTNEADPGPEDQLFGPGQE